MCTLSKVEKGKTGEKKVVFLRSNPVSPDPRVEKEARALTKAGFIVTVVGWDRECAFKRYESRGGLRIYRVKIRAHYGRGIGNLLGVLLWNIALTSWLMRHRDCYAIIHSCDFDTLIPALIMRFMFGKKVVYDVFDFYADMVRNVPNLLRSLIRRVDLFLMRFPDAVIIADECRRSQIKGAKVKRLEVIYNSPENFETVWQHGNYDGYALTIGYVGALQIERGILEMIDVVKRHAEWKLAIGGFGADAGIILGAIGSARNIEFVGRLPYEETMKLYSKCDVLFATYDPVVPNHKYSSPNKLFEAMMLGKPIIVARYTGMDELVGKHRLGFVIDYGNTAQLEEALNIIARWTVEQKIEFSRRVRRIFAENFSWELMEERLVRLYESF